MLVLAAFTFLFQTIMLDFRLRICSPAKLIHYTFEPILARCTAMSIFTIILNIQTNNEY